MLLGELYMAEHIYAMHDHSLGWTNLVRSAGKTAWSVESLEIGDDPGNRQGVNFAGRQEPHITVIGRLNFSHHGQGTIPLPSRYKEFAARCRNVVANSPGCIYWIIGNEPNLRGEWPQGVLIQPEEYARCFQLCREAIKSVDPKHQVLTAAVAPYNVDAGSWIQYHTEMLVEVGKADGIALHFNSRGVDPSSVRSEDKMNFPYQMYYNGFRAYRDLLGAVPLSMSHLPTFATETNQIEPWLDAANGWVREAYVEIDEWNQRPDTQKIYCLALYRWSSDDKWMINTKRGVIADFDRTLRETHFRVPSRREKVVIVPTNITSPTAIVTAAAGANVRSGPGLNYDSLGAVVKDAMLPVTGKNSNGEWWQVDTVAWGKGWMSASVIRLVNALNVPQINITEPIPPAAAVGFGREWLVSAWARVLRFDLTVIRAILDIESGGRSFENGRMIIRFENHIFHDKIKELAPQLEGTFQKHFRYGSPRHTGHAFRQSESAAWNNQHDGGQLEEWQVFSLARNIHETAAMLSISMGSAQVMGFNHRKVGYSTVQQMFFDYSHPNLGEYNQLTGFFAYVANTEGLVDAVRRKDWNQVGILYNGAESYGPTLHNRYLQLGGKD
jgi:hypothetical protein